ncbi:MAG: hypothetical protein R3E87_20540 [Burkholderiaceae bacterium]
MSLMTLQQIARAVPDGAKIAILKDDLGCHHGHGRRPDRPRRA